MCVHSFINPVDSSQPISYIEEVEDTNETDERRTYVVTAEAVVNLSREVEADCVDEAIAIAREDGWSGDELMMHEDAVAARVWCFNATEKSGGEA